MSIFLIIGLALGSFALLGIRDSRPKMCLYFVLLFALSGVYAINGWNDIWWMCLLGLPVLAICIGLLSNFVIDLYYTLRGRPAKGVNINWATVYDNEDPLKNSIDHVASVISQSKINIDNARATLRKTINMYANNSETDEIYDTIMTIMPSLYAASESKINDLRMSIVFTIFTVLEVSPDQRLHKSITNETIYNATFNAVFDLLTATAVVNAESN